MEWLEQFFPPCDKSDCPRAGIQHADILPHQRELIESKERYVALIGGYGAGKTLPSVVLGVSLSLEVDGNVGIVCRRSYSKLHDSTLRIFLEVLQRLGVEFKAREVRDGWPHRIILPNDSEIVFRETKDLGRFLGPEYGWFYIDEAGEEPKKTFTDLVGRLRLPQAKHFFKGFITSNPPHHTHWIAEVFGAAPGVSVRGASSYRFIKVSTNANPFVPESYISDLRANNPASEVKRIVDGDYGFTFEGKAVYAPPFSFEKHVTEAVPLQGYSIVRSWDFGYHAPAVTWHQFPRCNRGKIHWTTVHEYPGKDLESEDLARIVLAETRTLVPELPKAMIADCGDVAGAQISEKGPGPIIRLKRKPWELQFRYRKIANIDPGLALIREALGSPRCACGQPVYQISRECRHTIDMFAGGYHYPLTRPGQAGKDVLLKPVKDGFYDNLADSVRYVAENFYRGFLRDPDFMNQLVAEQGTVLTVDQPDRWEWMERGVVA